MSQTPILIVPGRGNSETGHWQSFVERGFSATQRVEQANWEAPQLDDWSRRIDRAVRRLAQPPLVVAHSFGCLAVAHAQLALATPIGATLFVAPADPQRFALPRRPFAQTLPAPALLLASANDPWLSLDAAVALADDWGIDCFNLGAVGHVNVASGHGRWAFGETLIALMRQRLDETAGVFSPAARRVAALPGWRAPA